jgi:hypothetical protein
MGNEAIISESGAKYIGDKLAEALKIALGGGDIGKFLGNKSSGSSGDAGKVNYVGLATEVAQATIAIGGMKDPTKAMASGLSALAALLPVGSQSAQNLINGMEDARQTNIKNAAQGIGGLNLFDVGIKANQAGIGIDAYREALTKSGGALNGIGGTAQQGSEALLKVGKSALALEMSNTGLVGSGMMTTDTFAKIGIMANYGRRESLNSIEAQAEQSAATRRLAKELQVQANITGRSTEALSAELDERLKQPEVLGAMRQMTEKQRESYVQNQAALGGMGNTVAGLSATLGVNGRMNEQQRYALAMMGPAAADFTRASQMAAKAQTEGEKEQARVAMEAAKAKINEYQGSSRYQSIMAGATGPAADAARKMYSENLVRDRQLSTQQTTGLSGVSAAQEQRKETDITLAGKKRDEKTGEVVADPGQAGSRLMTEYQLRFQANAIGMQKELGKLNTELGNSSEAIKNLRSILDKAAGPAPVPGKGSASDQAADRYKGTYDKVQAEIDKAKEAVGGDSAKGVDSTKKPKAPIKKEAEGSKAVWGDWFGGPAGLADIREAGPEAVVPQGKVGEFFKDMMGSLKSKKAPEAGTSSGEMPSMGDSDYGSSGDNVSLKDVVASLNQLNKTMAQVASHSESISESSHKSAKLAKKATGNRVAA